MSNPWGRIGTWAEQAEEEEREQQAEEAASASSTATGGDSQSFPSLKEATSSKPKKKKNVMTLSEFNLGIGNLPSSRSVGLTPDEMMQLPKGPKQRSSEELYRGDRLGGGFSNYGRSGGPRDRDGDSDGSWTGGRRSYGGFDDDRRGPARGASDFDSQPSRADGVDNWATAKKSMPPPMTDTGRVNRYGSLGGGSRADDVDNWASGKKPLQPPVRSNTFGSGFRDSGLDSDRWKRGDDRESDGGRRRLVLDPPRGSQGAEDAAVPVVAKTNKPNPFGDARPREEVLSEKGLDWKKLDLEIEAKKSSSRPTSSQGSRPSSAHSTRSEGTGFGQPGGQGIGAEQVVVKPRPKVNPFGDAKPREVLLEQKGKDWRKMDMDLEHRGVDRTVTEEEETLKKEIEQLKQELSNDTSQGLTADKSNLSDLISRRERDLELLTRELDDKVRFGLKSVERPSSRPGSGAGRPGSGAGRPGSGAIRYGGFSDRSHSQSGSSDDLRTAEFMDRPPSRGSDGWTRHGEDRRGGGFYGSRERGFLGNRDSDRNRSRERW
ncbi:hypothetical protein Dimus_015156 [Dionaea muscipula]